MDSAMRLPDAERKTLEAVCDAFVPSVRVSGANPPGLFARAASDLDVAALVVQALGAEPEALSRFRMLLRLLGSPAFGLTMAGRPLGFAQLPPSLREKVLQKMSASSLPFNRQAFQALKRTVLFVFYAAPGPAAGGRNPTWADIGYVPNPPPRPRTMPPSRSARCRSTGTSSSQLMRS